MGEGREREKREEEKVLEEDGFSLVTSTIVTDADDVFSTLRTSVNDEQDKTRQEQNRTSASPGKHPAPVHVQPQAVRPSSQL